MGSRCSRFTTTQEVVMAQVHTIADTDITAAATAEAGITEDIAKIV